MVKIPRGFFKNSDKYFGKKRGPTVNFDIPNKRIKYYPDMDDRKPPYGVSMSEWNKVERFKVKINRVNKSKFFFILYPEDAQLFIHDFNAWVHKSEWQRVVKTLNAEIGNFENGKAPMFHELYPISDYEILILDEESHRYKLVKKVIARAKARKKLDDLHDLILVERTRNKVDELIDRILDNKIPQII